MISLDNYKATSDWNIIRGYSKKFNPELENAMLEEEKKEFFDAYEEYKVTPKTKEYLELRLDIVTDMVDAVCDYLFVSVGLDTKTQLNTVPLEHQPLAIALKNTVDKHISVMGTLLMDVVGNKVDMNHCYTLVVEANNLKPAKENADGKGEKGDAWVDPKIKIKDYLVELGVTEYI